MSIRVYVRLRMEIGWRGKSKDGREGCPYMAFWQLIVGQNLSILGTILSDRGCAVSQHSRSLTTTPETHGTRNPLFLTRSLTTTALGILGKDSCQTRASSSYHNTLMRLRAFPASRKMPRYKRCPAVTSTHLPRSCSVLHGSFKFQLETLI